MAVLDGNVFRVLARYAGDATPIDTGKGRKHFQALVDRALGDVPAARFNQAIMDFGALVCTPKRADCGHCPLSSSCAALRAGTVYDLPVKGKKAERRDRFFHYLVITDDRDRHLIHQRDARDIWETLYQFPLVEADTIELSSALLAAHAGWPEGIPSERLQPTRRSKAYTHQLSHQRISVVFHVFEWKDLRLPDGFSLPPGGTGRFRALCLPTGDHPLPGGRDTDARILGFVKQNVGNCRP